MLMNDFNKSELHSITIKTVWSFLLRARLTSDVLYVSLALFSTLFFGTITLYCYCLDLIGWLSLSGWLVIESDGEWMDKWRAERAES